MRDINEIATPKEPQAPISFAKQKEESEKKPAEEVNSIEVKPPALPKDKDSEDANDDDDDDEYPSDHEPVDSADDKDEAKAQPKTDSS